MRVLLLAAAACGPSIPKFDPVLAQQNATKFVKTLFTDVQVNGPVCMPDPVFGAETQCSYSVKEAVGDWKVGTLLCGNSGCREGDSLASLPPGALPTDRSSTAYSGSGLSDDFLLYWMLSSSGGTTHHHYTSWYDSTPPQYRRTYYSNGYTPSQTSVKYFRSTYEVKPKSSWTSRPSSTTSSWTTRSTSPTKPTTSGFGTSKSTSVPRPTTSAPTKASPKVVPSSSRTRTSGYGVSRSVGGASSSRKK